MGRQNKFLLGDAIFSANTAFKMTTIIIISIPIINIWASLFFPPAQKKNSTKLPPVMFANTDYLDYSAEYAHEYSYILQG